jgi:HlyD family secretion protein
LRKLLLLLVLVVAAVIGWGVFRKSAPPQVKFTRVERTTLVSTLSTNGKAEPFEWQAVRAETAGVVSQVAVREGQRVAQGAALAAIADPKLAADVAAGEAKAAEARANLAALEAGGKPAELAGIENNLARARFDLQQHRKEYDTLKRLAEKQAAVPVDVDAAQDKVRQSEIEIEGLENRRKSLLDRTEIAAARARLQDVEVALSLARQRAGLNTLTAPIAGEIYGLAVRPGAYLNVGDTAANVGRLDRLRVRVYVDEPELGRVAEGQPVTITWDALPGKQWRGTVERKPASIQALGSRQVGEVICSIENSSRELVPGANVNAEIRTAVVEGALVVPKETLRHDAQGDYVFALNGETIARRPVRKGASSVTAIQVVEGLAEGDAVALPTDLPLKPGDRVAAAL